jgi:hypothetical protein
MLMVSFRGGAAWLIGYRNSVAVVVLADSPWKNRPPNAAEACTRKRAPNFTPPRQMNSFRDTVALWSSAVGAFLGLLGVLQSLTWLTAIGGIVVLGSLCAVAYARRQRRLVESAILKVAGRSIDSLNMASLRRRLNRSLLIQEAHNAATIHGEDLTITWECVGYCRAARETSIDFSVDADNNIPFEELECFAYDVQHDPERRHRIRPILVAPDGISKKIAVPFLRPLRCGEPFKIALTCAWPGCMKAGVDYYTTSFSFDQNDALHYSVGINFIGSRPQWLRAYEADEAGNVRLLKDLRPIATSGDRVVYEDAQRNLLPRSLRIYVFSRTLVPRVKGESLTRTAVG